MDIAEILEREPELAAAARRALSDPDAPFPILSAKIKLTWRCNLRCSMCSLWRGPLRAGRRPELTRPVVEEALDSLCRFGLRKVHFSGGEVLLLDWFRDVVDFSRGRDLQVNLTTNGTLIDKDMARFLVDRRVHSVTVSIDSSDPSEHNRIRGSEDAWERAWRGIDLLIERRRLKDRERPTPRVAVNTVITRENAEALGDLHSLLVERGVDRWRLLPIDTEERDLRPTADQWRELADRWDGWRPLLTRPPIDWTSRRSADRAAKGKYAGVFYGDRGCFAPWFNVFVDPGGEVYPCCMSKGQIRPYGAIPDEPIEKVLSSARRREVLCSMASGHAFEVCDRCDDFLEENAAFARLIEEEQEPCG